MPTALMSAYERALELSRAMLEAARKSDWEQLVTLERERSRVIEDIRLRDPEPGRDGAGRERKRELIQAVMHCDEQITLLTQDWMHELREVLGSISAEQRLSRTYGPQQGR
jgi:flagellar protein FliT